MKNIFNFILNLIETDHVLDLFLDGKHAIRETRCEYEHWTKVIVILRSYSGIYEDSIYTITNIISLTF
jgi:hypothetical protein